MNIIEGIKERRACNSQGTNVRSRAIKQVYARTAMQSMGSSSNEQQYEF